MSGPESILGSPAPPWRTWERRFLAAAVLVAVALRLLHWWSLARYPWFDFLGLDAKYYDDWAQRILVEGLQGDEPYFMGPLYPHLLALVYAVVGRSLDAVRFLQVLMSASTVVLLHRLGRIAGGPRLAAVVAAITAVYGPLVYYSVSILYPTLTVFLSAAILLALVEAASRRSLRLAALAGATLGVYALGRGNILLFAPVAFFWLVTAWGRPGDPRWRNWRAGLRAGLVLTLATLGPVLLATIHNIRAGDPALITTNGGLNFYIGNGPMATGGHETPVLEIPRPDGTVERIVADLHKDVECRTEAERATGRSLTYTEVSRFWFDETLRTIRRDPGAFVGRLVMKFSHFWSVYEIPQIEHFGYFRRYSLALKGPALTFGLIGPLAVLGMVVAWRERRRWALPYLFVVAYSTSIILFFVLARYRLPIVPALFLFAGHGALALVDSARARRWAPFAALLAGGIGVGGLMRANFYRIDEGRGIAQILYRHGIVADSAQDWEAAIGHYRSALALKPEYDKAHLNLGVDLARVGRVDEGIEHLLKAEALDPQYYRAPFNRGSLLEGLGRWDEARDAYARSVEIEPRYLPGRVALGEMHLVAGDHAAARREFEAVMAYEGSWESELNPAARARAQRGLAFLAELEAEGSAALAECFEAATEFRQAEVARMRGRAAEALDALRRYFEAGGTCGPAYRLLGDLLLPGNELPGAEDAYRRALAASPGLGGTRIGLAQIAAIRGDAAAAIDWLRQEVALFPGDPRPMLELGLVYERLAEDREEAERWFGRYEKAGGSLRILEARRRGWSPEETRGESERP